eukprot:CAMPEP_0204510760 /NCGR_PEP_ID=MMETSP0661-20131031/67_1 /ASSEMBLY_ACC=CAM_ASM_000606 /TAXON_ID=109239 /ORGANISM="Alexandrium margalefi, Strain AMGDE01CS-322" /LENGTH=102 /DNA_ID=CAMNT_0051515809 /DNA_START=85 /DNA_END=390 /DNA_ORIENTATION=+
MASKTRVLPAVLAAAACALLLRSLMPSSSRASDAFAAPAQTVHRGCRPRTLVPTAAGRLAASPAVLSGVPARSGVAAHYKVTLETPDGQQEFECPEDVYVLD